MSLRRHLRKLVDLSGSFARQPGVSFRLLGQLSWVRRGFDYAQHFESAAVDPPGPPLPPPGTAVASSNPLKEFFDSRDTGRGISKWTHYFDIYNRHFSRFVGKEVKVLEIGVFSGGSLEMWRHYFGPRCRVYGVDVNEACRSYGNEFTEIFIGDQADRGFWKVFKKRVPHLDILVDDGGHRPEQQIATLEEMLPHLRPGGVYLCEDIHGTHNGFAAYMLGLVRNLNAMTDDPSQPGVRPSPLQASIHSVHFYPYVTVIEKTERPVPLFIAPRRGTEWQA